MVLLALLALLALFQTQYILISITDHDLNIEFVTSSSSRLLEEQIKKVSEIAFAAKDFSDDSYNNSLLFPNVGIMRGGGISECPYLSPNLVVKKQNTSTTSRTAEWNFLVGNIKRKSRQGRVY